MAIVQPTQTNTNLSGTPTADLKVGAPILPPVSSGSAKDNTLQTTPIISANQAIDHYVNAKNFLDQTQQGVSNQASNVAASKVPVQPSQAPASNPINATPTGAVGTQSVGASGAVDNSDLTKALNNASTALGNPSDNIITNADKATQNNNRSLYNDQITRDSSTQQFNDAVAKITSGTFPLTAPQQASLNQTQQAVNSLIQSAEQQAQIYQQAGTTFGAVHGLAQFAPGLALQAISKSMADGQAAIAKAEMDGAKQLSDLQKGFADDDFNMISKSYDALQSSLDKKDTLLNKLNTDIQKQVTDYNTQQDKLQTNAKDALNTILTQLGGTAFKDLSPEAQAQLAQLEKTAGWPAGLVEKGLDTVAQQKAQAAQAQAAQNEADRVTQNKIADEFKQAALNLSQQRINITLSNQAGNTENGKVAGITGSPTIDVTQPGYASQAVPGAGGLTQAAIDQAALQYATTGVMPSIGLGSTGAAGQKRNAIENRAGELNSGGNIAANKATLSANTSALKQQTNYINTVTRAINNAQQGVQQLINSFKDKGINDSSLPISNIIQNASKYQLGNGDVSAYKAGLQEVANEYTQVFSRGGQTSESTRNQAQSIIDGNISIANLQKVSDELQQQGDIVIKGAAGQIKSIQDNINGIVTGDSGSSTGSSGAQPANTTAMIDSNGKLYYIPNDKVTDAKSSGLKFKAPSQ